MMPKLWLAANWKMNKTVSEGQAFVDRLVEQIPGLVKPGAGEVQVLIFPGLISLQSVATAARDTTIRVGAQDCYFEAHGAFTGEVSLPQIKDAGGSAVIVGHSERRHVFSEDNQRVAAKLRATINAGVLAVLCVGELAEERDAGDAQRVVDEQLETALASRAGVTERTLAVAYEPVWAIGTGRSATVPDVEEIAVFIRERLVEYIGEERGKEIAIMYGGSVKPGNLSGYMSIRDINGALVGGASLDAGSFAALYREMEGQ
jgi:triosephosphate isomerase